MKTWGILTTFGFAILAFVLGQSVGLAALAAVGSIDFSTIDRDGTAVAVLTLVANPIQVVTLMLAARLTGSSAWEYFALALPRGRDVAIALGILVVAIVLADVVTYVSGHEIVPAFQLDITRTSQANGTLVLLLLAVVVAAPIGEELMFRGFLFRGLVNEPRNSLPAIVVISLIWALLHAGQYDLFGVSLIFAIGMLFGYARYLTGSTALTILMHMLFNLESMAETALALKWL
jgi:uncharacterized protein